MQKLASEFIKTSVVAKAQHAILGPLKDIIINPDTGKAIGIAFEIAGKKGETMVANISDVSGAGTNFIMIETVDNAGTAEEIIRIKEVLDRDITLLDSDVVDEDSRRLGKVIDYSVSLNFMRLERLYVESAGLFKLVPSDLMIPQNDIIKIEKDKITVRGGSVKARSKVSALVKTGARRPTKARAAHMKKQT